MFRLNAVSNEEHQARWHGEVLVGQQVVYTTPEAYDTADEALSVAEQHAADAFRRLFSMEA
jgi:hypothetical protein